MSSEYVIDKSIMTPFNGDVVKEAKELNVDIPYSKIFSAYNSGYSSLMPYHVKQSRALYKKHGGKPFNSKPDSISIVDITANVGVDSFNFYYYFKKMGVKTIEVISIENDKPTYEVLKKNANIIDNDSIKPVFYNGVDYILEYSEKLQNSIVYMDPPWGGPDYYKNPNLDLTLTSNDGKAYQSWELINMLMKGRDKGCCVILKAPVNFNYKDFRKNANFNFTYGAVNKRPKKSGKVYPAYYLYFCTSIEDKGEKKGSSDYNNIGNCIYDIVTSGNKHNKIEMYKIFSAFKYKTSLSMREIKDILNIAKTCNTKSCDLIIMKEFFKHVNKYLSSNGDDVLRDMAEYEERRVANRINILKSMSLPLNSSNKGKKKYLDFGAGDGKITVGIANYFGIKLKDVIAVDKEEWAGQKLKHVEDIEYIYIDDEDDELPFQTNTFSLVTAFHSLHHTVNCEEIINELYRVCKNGGILFLCEHDAKDKNISKLIDIEHMVYSVSNDMVEPELFKEKYYGSYKSSKEWKDLFEEVGFELINEKFRNNPTRTFYYMFYKK